jgi:glycopeptide antibiotics resistance protein
VRKVIFTAGYFIGLLFLVLLNPERIKEPIPLKSRLRIHPIVDSLKDIMYPRGSSWWLHWFHFLTNLFGNIVLFIPFSFIAIIVFKLSRFIWVVLLACALSVAIEVIQYYTGLGVADADDVILNTAGAAIGFYLCKRYLNRQ